MKFKLTAAFVCISMAGSALAADKILSFPMADVIGNEKFSDKFEGVRFYLDGAATPRVLKTLGEIRTSKRTNGFNKSDLASCQIAMASALASFAKEAKEAGGNAVIQIKSNWKNDETSSPTDYKCGAGGLMSGVALTGKIAKIP